MNASEFYRAFESGLISAPLPRDCRRLAGKTSKWKVPIQGGALQFNFSTNSKASGLLDQLLWPGEFRLLLDWHQGTGKAKTISEVSLFQYTTASEVDEFCALQVRALEKYLGSGGPDPYGTLTDQANDREIRPKPNTADWCYYFDEDDARSWGTWFGRLMSPWIERFVTSPESRDDWCWRVLWPHLKRQEKD